MQEFISNRHTSRPKARIVQLSLLLLAIGLLTSCLKEENATRPYPRLETLEVTGINESGATFNANVISGDLSEIKEVGFVWGLTKNPILAHADTVSIKGKMTQGSFQALVSNSMLKDQTYYVRSFAVTDQYISYGSLQTFKSLGCKAPLITGFYPRQAGDLDTITVTGDYFSSNLPNMTVFMDGIQVKVIESERTRLRFIIPVSNRSGEVKIRVVVAKLAAESPDFLNLEGVSILAVEPQQGLIAKDIITLTGEGFSPELTRNNLTINGSPIELLTASAQKLSFRLPYNTKPGISKIIVTRDGRWATYTGVFESITPWTKKISLPVQASGYNSAFTLNGKMYIHNHYSLNDPNFFEYNPGTNQITSLAKYPGIMENRGVGFALNGKGYIGAGWDHIGQAPQFHAYDPAANSWVRVASLPGYISSGPIGAMAFANNSKAYLFCGIEGSDNAIKSMDYHVYDPALNQWSVLGNLKSLVNYDEWSKGAGFMIDDNIYLSGGSVKNTNFGYISYRKTWRFNVASNTWTALADFPVDREDAVGFAINGKGYIGSGAYKRISGSDFYEYDPAMNTWTRIADLPANGSDGLVAVVIAGKAYVLTTLNSEIWEYDPQKH